MGSIETGKSIGVQLHNLLREAIVRGELRPGEALSETDIAARYSVSRQPVREAFIRLAQERLVAVLPQRGTFVVKISIRDVQDVRFVREAIEIAVVREAAEQRDPALVKSLRSILAQQRKVKGGDNAAFLALDEQFHQTIALATGREHAWRVIDQIKAQMDRVRYLSYDAATPLSRLVEQHTAIVDAIEAGDPIAAEKAMHHHQQEILQSLSALAQRFPDAFEL
ncbi:GntR family transcriptional regulator [Viridibacterium curvum]|uniref:GntR family transcriptional regulator n=1 Tax=Viridibacterium curvum TaxID=1101404 RepID=A0ABP9QBN2_9RHOO